jgi:uncharacterized membrane protein YbaN (DUF454 family)
MLGLGHLCLAIGLIGIPLPLLPTTPFLLLAAFFYARGSQRFHDWLYQHRRLGPTVRDWNRYGIIRPRAKLAATLLLSASLTYAILAGDFGWELKAIAAAVGVCVLAFVLSRPSGRKDEGPEMKDQG